MSGRTVQYCISGGRIDFALVCTYDAPPWVHIARIDDRIDKATTMRFTLLGIDEATLVGRTLHVLSIDG